MFGSWFVYRILSSYWLAHFYLLKNPPKCWTILVWIAAKSLWWYKVTINYSCTLSNMYSTVRYIIGAIPGGLLSGQILFSSLRSVQLEVSCTESKLANPQKNWVSNLKGMLELTGVPDPWHFDTDPDALHWITDPDPALLFCDFQCANNEFVFFLSYFACTFISAFKDKKLSRSHKTEEVKVF
jgi:hypothetical protein